MNNLIYGVRLFAIAGILAIVCMPAWAQSNTNATLQEGRVNINLTHQCGDRNDNTTYQDGRVNINRTVQRCGDNRNRTAQFGAINHNRTEQRAIPQRTRNQPPHEHHGRLRR